MERYECKCLVNSNEGFKDVVIQLRDCCETVYKLHFLKQASHLSLQPCELSYTYIIII